MGPAKPLAVLAFASLANAHGYLWEPPSRVRLGFEAGTDTCPECTILEPVESWPDLDVAPVSRSGVCGYNARVSVDYNTPGASWGTDTVATYAPGDIITVVWCVDSNGDHGGMFTYRACQDDSVIAPFLEPGYTPTDDEKQAAEDCFEAGVLPCTDVSGQTCDYSPDCTSGEACWNNTWFTCDQFGNGGCIGVDAAPVDSCSTTTAGGHTVTKQIQLPDFESEHTLLSWKWNSFQTGQIYLGCADIALVAGAGGGGSGGGSGGNTTTTTTSASPTTLTTSTTSASTPTATASGCAVAFSASVSAGSGETVKIAGSISQLGSWAPADAIAMTGDGSGSTWTVTVSIPAGTSFEYKYIQVDGSGNVNWEADPNRSYSTDGSCDQTVSVQGTWQQ
ncbi:starch binding domain-containing protein [Xylariales sp. PMI_506]|nr:starch binding domain-containing protein [Xylariales sp. PMI_506]